MLITLSEETKQYFQKACSKVKAGYIPDNDPKSLYDSGIQWISHLFAIDAIRCDDHIFDMGCGNGRLAMPLVDWSVRYTGFDVIEQSVTFCNEVFKKWEDRFKFFHLNLFNSYYNPNGNIDPLNYKFDFPDKSFDLIILCSILTHIESTKIAEAYLSEVSRLVKDGGRVWLTWFRSPPNEENYNAQRTAFKESFIINSISKFGFSVEYTRNGFSPYWNDQWEMLLKKSENKK